MDYILTQIAHVEKLLISAIFLFYFLIPYGISFVALIRLTPGKRIIKPALVSFLMIVSAFVGVGAILYAFSYLFSPEMHLEMPKNIGLFLLKRVVLHHFIPLSLSVFFFIVVQSRIASYFFPAIDGRRLLFWLFLEVIYLLVLLSSVEVAIYRGILTATFDVAKAALR